MCETVLEATLDLLTLSFPVALLLGMTLRRWYDQAHQPAHVNVRRDLPAS